MKVSTLRVGNLIAHNGSVLAVRVEDLVKIEKDTGNLYQPIPLTKKRVERFGFVEVEARRWTLKGFQGFQLTQFISGGNSFTAIQFTAGPTFYVLKMHLLFVHELQNLYWALRDDELVY